MIGQLTVRCVIKDREVEGVDHLMQWRASKLASICKLLESIALQRPYATEYAILLRAAPTEYN
jgi:hypothetical protein